MEKKIRGGGTILMKIIFFIITIRNPFLISFVKIAIIQFKIYEEKNMQITIVCGTIHHIYIRIIPSNIESKEKNGKNIR